MQLAGYADLTLHERRRADKSNAKKWLVRLMTNVDDFGGALVFHQAVEKCHLAIANRRRVAFFRAEMRQRPLAGTEVSKSNKGPGHVWCDLLRYRALLRLRCLSDDDHRFPGPRL